MVFRLFLISIKTLPSNQPTFVGPDSPLHLVVPRVTLAVDVSMEPMLDPSNPKHVPPGCTVGKIHSGDRQCRKMLLSFLFGSYGNKLFQKKNLTESSEFKDLSIFPLFSKPLPKPVFRFDSEQRRLRPPVGQVLLVDSVPSSSASKGGEIWGF